MCMIADEWVSSICPNSILNGKSLRLPCPDSRPRLFSLISSSCGSLDFVILESIIKAVVQCGVELSSTEFGTFEEPVPYIVA